MLERRLRLTLGYRGTRYAGWAVQTPSRTRGRPTLQASLETALAHALGHQVRVTAAGRTDAGVHADAQVVSFDTTSTMTPAGLQRVLERWIPDDVWVVEVADAAPGFDARRSVLRRWYRYAVWRQGVPSTSWQGRCLVVDEPLDVDRMRRGAAGLLGRRDFTSLATAPPPRQSTHRTIFAADWLDTGNSPLLILEICADAFLKQMVRAIVGSLLWVGSGHWSPERFSAAVASADRRAAGPNAPAIGLSLHRIEY
ncbi:MAG: tRNA pseudouridine(38-40) synthase TruA [Chloroflexota bacterium]